MNCISHDRHCFVWCVVCSRGPSISTGTTSIPLTIIYPPSKMCVTIHNRLVLIADGVAALATVLEARRGPPTTLKSTVKAIAAAVRGMRSGSGDKTEGNEDTSEVSGATAGTTQAVRRRARFWAAVLPYVQPMKIALAICVAALFVVLPRCVPTSPSSWWRFEITRYRVLIIFPAYVLPAVTCVTGTRTRCRTGCAWPSSCAHRFCVRTTSSRHLCDRYADALQDGLWAVVCVAFIRQDSTSSSFLTGYQVRTNRPLFHSSRVTSQAFSDPLLCLVLLLHPLPGTIPYRDHIATTVSDYDRWSPAAGRHRARLSLRLRHVLPARVPVR